MAWREGPGGVWFSLDDWVKLDSLTDGNRRLSGTVSILYVQFAARIHQNCRVVHTAVWSQPTKEFSHGSASRTWQLRIFLVNPILISCHPMLKTLEIPNNPMPDCENFACRWLPASYNALWHHHSIHHLEHVYIYIYVVNYLQSQPPNQGFFIHSMRLATTSKTVEHNST